ncbi:MAG: heavy-metal-associated domain-containing protein [Cardiobacteriaceae bacterium]|nr:heavy-metal-associated domain-containing protein [Cardiobacteriaceae bacterium]
MKTVTIHIDGMTCNGCANGVKKALEALPVADVAVSLEAKRATLQYDDSATTVEALIEAIENAGFDARV